MPRGASYVAHKPLGAPPVPELQSLGLLQERTKSERSDAKRQVESLNSEIVPTHLCQRDANPLVNPLSAPQAIRVIHLQREVDHLQRDARPERAARGLSLRQGPKQ